MIERIPCAIKLLQTSKNAASFHDFEEFERLIEAAGRTSAAFWSPARRRGRSAMWRDDGAPMVGHRPDETPTVCGPFRMEGSRHGAERWTTAVRAADQEAHRCTEAGTASARRRVLCDTGGQPLTQKVVQVTMRRTRKRANVKHGVHILRHTFCSHLAMRGAPARAIQELAGHQDLGTTQRYMHLSPAAIDAAIRLLETAAEPTKESRPWRNCGGGGKSGVNSLIF